MTEKKRKNTDPIVFLGVFVILLMICVSWSFRRSNFIAGSFRIEEVQICEELDENLQPMNVDRNMSSESTQVAIWFSYSSARRGDLIEITWYRNESIIQKETLRLTEPRGVKAFYLLREDGSPLESGFYSVYISCNGRGKLTENFTIAASEGDFLMEDEYEEDNGDFTLDYEEDGEVISDSLNNAENDP